MEARHVALHRVASRCDVTPRRRLTCTRHVNKSKAFPRRKVPSDRADSRKLISRTLDEDARLPVRFGRRCRMRQQHNSIGRFSSPRPTTRRAVNTRQKAEIPAWQTCRDAPQSNKSEYVAKVTGDFFVAQLIRLSRKNHTSQLFNADSRFRIA